MTSSSIWIGRLLVRLLAAMILTAAVMPLLPSSGAALGDSTAFAVPIGKLSRVPDDARAVFGDGIVPKDFFTPGKEASDPTGFGTAGTLLIFPEARQLWQLWRYTKDNASVTGVAVRDIETLRITKSFVIPGAVNRGTVSPTSAGEWMHAYDPGKRVFLVVDNINVVEINLSTFATKLHSSFLPGGSQAVFAGLRLGGITFDPFTDSLIGLAGGPSSLNAANTNTYLFKKDLATNATAGPRPLSSCTGPLPSVDQSVTYAVPVLPTSDAIYIPCHRLGMAGAVVKVNRATAFTPDAEEEASVGPVYMEGILADPPSGRLFLTTTRGEIWAFDTATMSFIGVVSTYAVVPGALSIGYGLDRETGRLFFQSKSYGLGVAEGRFFPIPQGLTMPSVTATGQERILSDARSGHLFVLGGAFTSKSREYAIYSVKPAPSPPAAPNPDRSTIDRAEEKGVTQSRYFASGSGYGFRSLLANGVATIAPAPTAGVLAPTAQVLSKNLYSKCGFSDREMVAGRVKRAEYDPGSTAASAIAVGVDDRTKQDLVKPSRCDFAASDGSTERFSGIFSTFPQASEFDKGTGWNHDAAECTSSEEQGEDISAVGDDHGEVPLGKSSVECPRPGGALQASAEGSMAGAIAVGKASSDVSIKKTSKGVLTEVTSVARDINIADVIKIEEVRSTASSLANGRPGKGDLSTHEIFIKGLNIAGDEVCPAICKDLGGAITQLNRASAGKVQFRVGSGIDEGLKKGTPMGALTAVQKSSQRQASDQALVGDFTTEVPALEMIVYNDNTEWGRARQLYQFAGVSTVAGYSIAMDSSALQLTDDPVDEDSGGGLLTDGTLGADTSFDSGGRADTPSSIEVPIDNIGNNSPAAPGENLPTRVLQAIGRGLRLFFTQPRTAALLFTAWSLFSMPALLSRRRRLLAAARSH